LLNGSVDVSNQNARLTHWPPDPMYARLREILAAIIARHPSHRGGAGASELIVRLIRHIDGTVQQLAPTFSEYARGARLADRRLISARSPGAFLRAQSTHPGVGFICWPNNPTGDLWSADFVSAASKAGPLVVDLAYAPLCDPHHAAAIEAAAVAAYRLYSPNKAFGLTACAARTSSRRERSTPCQPGAQLGDRPRRSRAARVRDRTAGAPLARARDAQLKRWRARLARSLEQLGLSVRESLPRSFGKGRHATHVSAP